MNIREILNRLDNINQPLHEMTWQDIYNLNKDQIKNPNLIYPNQKLKMPDGSTYTVAQGDNLTKIAKTYKPAETPPAAPVSTAPDQSDAETQRLQRQNAQATPAPATQSGQPTPPVQQPGKVVQIAQAQPEPGNDYDPNRAVDVHRPTGFNWGKIRSKADTDYSTGDIGFKPKDGSPGIREPFQKSSVATPQTGGTFNSSGYDSNVGINAIDDLRKLAGYDLGKTSGTSTQSGQATNTTPSSTSSQTPAQTPAQQPKPNTSTGPTGPTGQPIPGPIGPGRTKNN